MKTESQSPTAPGITSGEDYLRQKREQLDRIYCDEVDGCLSIKPEHQHFGCPYCNTSDCLPYNNPLVSKGLHFVRCRTCQLVYPLPRLSSNSLNARVDAPILNKYYAYRHNQRMARVSSSMGKNVVEPIPKEFRRELGFISRWSKADASEAPKALEVGCGDGQFLGCLAGLGYLSRGVEPNSATAAFAQSCGLDVFNGLFQPGLPFPPHAFDLIAMRETLYHFYDLSAAMKLARGLLADEGLLYIKSFNVDSFAIRRFARASGGINGLDIPCNFSPISLKYILKDSGFEILDTVYFPEQPLGEYLIKWDLVQSLFFRYPKGALNRIISGLLIKLGKSRNFAVMARKTQL